MPRTFQGRLTIAFVAVIALTLALVSGLVINRLDAYFADQQQADLASRTKAVAAYVAYVAERAAPDSLVVDANNSLHAGIAEAMANLKVQHSIADVFGQADVIVSFGRLVPNGESPSIFVPAVDGTFRIPVRIAPSPGQNQESIDVPPTTITGGTIFGQYAAQVTLVDPYTVRATAIGNVTGLLAAIALFALGLSVVVAAALARRFTSPLRQLTDAASALAEGDLGRRVPIRQVRASSSEMAELAVQFNAMADRVEESVEIIRRDRDRSRDFLADVSHELRTPLPRCGRSTTSSRSGPATIPRPAPSSSNRAGADRTAGLAGPEPARAVQARFRAGPARPATRRPSGGRRDRRRTEHGRGSQARDHAATRAARRARPDPPRPPADRPGGRQPRGQRGQVHAARRHGRRGLAPTADGARIDVTDTGVGIDPAELPHIFERFYRGSRANEARGSGSGLGLAIVRSIVDMHGGTVVVESRVGEGSRFVVELPRDPRLVEGTPAAERSAVASAAVAGHREVVRNVTETSPSDRPQVNPEPAP